MKLRSLIGAVVFLATIIFLVPTRATPNPSASPQPSSVSTPSRSALPVMSSLPRSRLISFHGMIASIDQKTKTFVVAGKEKPRSVRVTEKTTITKLGLPATVKDIIDNEEVRGTCYKDPAGLLEAKTLKLGPLTDAEKAAQKSYKEGRAEKKIGDSPAVSPTASSSVGPKT